MQEQDQDRKSNIPNPYGDWADAQGYERDEPGSNPTPELGSLKAQSKAGIGAFAPEDEPVSAYPTLGDFLTNAFGNLESGLCACGKPLGHGPEDDEESGSGDPDAARDLEDKLRAAFGNIFPGIPVEVANVANGPALSVQDIIVMNAALQITALTLSSIDARRNGDMKAAALFTSTASDRLKLITDQVGSGQYAMAALSTIGERILDVAQDMNDGKTVGLVRAPF